MGYRMLTDRQEISGAVNLLFDNLEKEGAETISNVHINKSRGGTEPATSVKYNKRLDIWWLPDRDASHHKNMYWNCFGVKKPKKNASIAVQFIIDLEGHKARKGGALVKDDNNNVHIAHKGNISHGGPDLKDAYKDRMVKVTHGENINDYILISAIDEPELPKRIAEFVKAVRRVKDERRPRPPKFTIDSIIKEGCFVRQEKLQTALDQLKNKKNLILQGPPGTGKTWLAKRLAFALIGSKDADRIMHLQFHANMSYEDFVRGWRPAGDGRLERVRGPFLRLAGRAGRRPDEPHVCIIEEINRGNPARTFGEMLTLLEADKRGGEGTALTLTHDREDEEPISLPENLYVIGTMNLADRAVAMVDMAFRRRFAFVDLEPVFGEPWSEWMRTRCHVPDELLRKIEGRMSELNAAIGRDDSVGEHFLIGHSMVTRDSRIDNPVEWFMRVVETEVGPLLAEYFFDRPDEAEKLKQGLTKGLA